MGKNSRSVQIGGPEYSLPLYGHLYMYPTIHLRSRGKGPQIDYRLLYIVKKSLRLGVAEVIKAEIHQYLVLLKV